MRVILEKIPRAVRPQVTRHESFLRSPHPEMNATPNIYNIPQPRIFQEHPPPLGGGHQERPLEVPRQMPREGHPMAGREPPMHAGAGHGGGIPIPPPVHGHQGGHGSPGQGQFRQSPTANVGAQDDIAIVDSDDDSDVSLPAKPKKNKKHQPPIVIPDHRERSRGKGYRSPTSSRSDYSDSFDGRESPFESPPSSVFGGSRDHEPIYIKPSGGGHRKSSSRHDRKDNGYHHREHRRRSPAARRRSSFSSNDGYVMIPKAKSSRKKHESMESIESLRSARDSLHSRKERPEDRIYQEELRRQRDDLDRETELEQRRQADEQERIRRRAQEDQIEIAHLKGKLEGMRYKQHEPTALYDRLDRLDRLDRYDPGYGITGRYDGARERLPPLHRAISDRPFSYLPPRRRNDYDY